MKDRYRKLFYNYKYNDWSCLTDEIDFYFYKVLEGQNPIELFDKDINNQVYLDKCLRSFLITTRLLK